ncbi:MAG: hypothetical protein ACRDJ3_06915, partial [Solirubrobacteraceae bacterium]
MDGRPFVGWGLVGVLRRAGTVACACAVLVLLPTAAGAAETVVNFDGLAAGELVGNQYEGQGLRLGTSTTLGLKAPSLGDCGSPSVQKEGSPGVAFSSPNYALLAKCKADPASPNSSGTYGRLLGQGRGSVSVEVRNLTVGGLPPVAKLTGFNSTGEPVVSEEASLSGGGW